MATKSRSRTRRARSRSASNWCFDKASKNQKTSQNPILGHPLTAKRLHQVQPVALQRRRQQSHVHEAIALGEFHGGFVPAEEVDFAHIAAVGFLHRVFGQAHDSLRSFGFRESWREDQVLHRPRPLEWAPGDGVRAGFCALAKGCEVESGVVLEYTQVEQLAVARFASRAD